MEVNYEVGLGLRWLHIFAAMALVGGALFQRFTLLGASAELPEDVRARLAEQIRRRWSKVVMLSILLLLVSGIINYFVIIGPYKAHQTDLQNTYPQLKLGDSYHMLFGIKFLIGLVIFFIASALAGRGRATARMRANAAGWLTLNLLLAVVLVAISGIMRARHTGPNFDKVWEELNNPRHSDAPPAATGGTAQGTGTQPVAVKTQSAEGVPGMIHDFPNLGPPGK